MPSEAPDLNQAKQAAKAAATYYKELVPKVRINKLRLEEIDYLSERKEFKITLSYPQDDNDSLFGYDDKRDYKIFIVDAAQSIVKSMLMRED